MVSTSDIRLMSRLPQRYGIAKSDSHHVRKLRDKTKAARHRIGEQRAESRINWPPSPLS